MHSIRNTLYARVTWAVQLKNGSTYNKNRGDFGMRYKQIPSVVQAVQFVNCYESEVYRWPEQAFSTFPDWLKAYIDNDTIQIISREPKSQSDCGSYIRIKTYRNPVSIAMLTPYDCYERSDIKMNTEDETIEIIEGCWIILTDKGNLKVCDDTEFQKNYSEDGSK